MSDLFPYTPLIDPLRALARQAGELILTYYQEGLAHEKKADHSPVTEADKRANELIVQAIARLAPGMPMVSEEGDQPEGLGAGAFWLVDPLDGTRSFLERDGEFTVNIALIENFQPVLGVMLVPVSGALYWAEKSGGAFRQIGANGAVERIFTRQPSPEGYDVVTSKSHASPGTDKWLSALNVRNRVKAGSALKLARVAEGAADLYPRLGRTMEWDIAAGHCIVEAAGGMVLALEKNQKPQVGIPPFISSSAEGTEEPLALRERGWGEGVLQADSQFVARPSPPPSPSGGGSHSWQVTPELLAAEHFAPFRYGKPGYVNGAFVAMGSNPPRLF